MVTPDAQQGPVTTNVLLGPGAESPQSRWRRTSREVVDWLRTLMSSAVYATLIVTFVGQVARVEGRSMLPTLEDQDRLIVNKLVYLWEKPRVGDIVMVASPHAPDTTLVKRVVALPGDVVRSEKGRVYRNDVPVPDDFVPDEYRSSDTWGPEVVPEGFYFVLGDHRNNSSDSRLFGPVPEKYIKGRVQVRWWPLGHGHLF
ncbi:MAG: signal peptidase I [Vicinamibacterales bacterium]